MITFYCMSTRQKHPVRQTKPARTDPKEIAYRAGVSVTTVYKKAAKLGRLPTVEEAKPKPGGRPRKYF